MNDETKIDYDAIKRILTDRTRPSVRNYLTAVSDDFQLMSCARELFDHARATDAALTAEREWVRMLKERVRMLKEIIQTHHIERHGTSLPMELCRRSPCRALAQTQGKEGGDAHTTRGQLSSSSPDTTPPAVVSSDGGRARSKSEQFLAAWDTAYLHRSNHGFGLSRREEVLRNLDRIFDVDSRIGGGK